MSKLGEGISTIIGVILANIPIILFILGFIVLNVGVWFYLGWGALVVAGISVIIISVILEMSIKDYTNK